MKRPGTWLGLLGLAVMLGVLDTFRAPASQVTGRLYTGAVGIYQRVRGDRLGKYVRCRFHPSCSDYSKAAVRIHGIRYGLVLTVERLCRCTGATPLNSRDPVPDPDPGASPPPGRPGLSGSGPVARRPGCAPGRALPSRARSGSQR